jgi:hypothetical protein
VRSEGRDKFESIVVDDKTVSSKYEDVECIHLVPDKHCIELSGSLKSGKFVVRLTTACFSRRTFAHVVKIPSGQPFCKSDRSIAK